MYAVRLKWDGLGYPSLETGVDERTSMRAKYVWGLHKLRRGHIYFTDKHSKNDIQNKTRNVIGEIKELYAV